MGNKSSRRFPGLKSTARGGGNTSFHQQQTAPAQEKDRLRAPHRHEGAVLGITSASDDGSHAVTCGEDGHLLWVGVGTESGEEGMRHPLGRSVTQWCGHNRPVTKVIWGCNSRRLFSASRDASIGVWRMEGASPCRLLQGHDMSCVAVSLSPDEAHVCSGGRDTTVRVWDPETGDCLRCFQRPRNIVTCVKYILGESGGHQIAQGGEDLSVKIWDVRQAATEPVQTLGGYTYFPLDVDVSRDGVYVLTGSKGFNSVGCTGMLWDRRAGKVVTEYKGHSQDITACALLTVGPEERACVATVSKDETLKIWERDTGDVILNHEACCGMYTGMSAQGQRLWTSTFSGGVHALSLSSTACNGANMLDIAVTGSLQEEGCTTTEE
jgi:WD40 repeat protein